MLPTEVLLAVTDVLEHLSIPYCVGGSFASSTYGEPRATRDADILIALPGKSVESFASHIESDFFVQITELRDAVARAPSLRNDPLHRATCNLVHRRSFFRIDLFISSGRPFEVEQLARRIQQTVVVNPERSAYFVSPEDIILNKLEWYRMAQGILDRQWHDILSVLVTQGDTLDLAYLRDWASRLMIADLLDAALRGTPAPKLMPPGDESQQMRLDI